MVCNKQLSTGEELYVIDENKFVCKEDYLSSGAIKEVSLNSGNQALTFLGCSGEGLEKKAQSVFTHRINRLFHVE